MTDSNLEGSNSNIVRTAFSGAKVASELIEQSTHAQGTDEHLGETQTEYHFAFCIHEPEFVPQIYEAVKDCDIIAVETLMRGDAREVLQEAYSAYTAEGLDPAQRTHILVEAWRKTGTHDAFIRDLLEQLAGTDKRIVLIDADKDDPRLVELGAVEDSRKQDLAQDIENHQPNDRLRVDVVPLVTATNQVHAYRESIVVEQLNQLSTSPDQDHKLDIGVVAGLVHTPMSHALSRSGHKISRRFIDDNQHDLEPTEKARYTSDFTLLRSNRFHPDRELEPGQVDKLLLLFLYETYAADTDWNLIQHCVDGMPSTEISSLMDDIDNVKQELQEPETIDSRISALLKVKLQLAA
jgi:hypothetical protein